MGQLLHGRVYKKYFRFKPAQNEAATFIKAKQISKLLNVFPDYIPGLI